MVLGLIVLELSLPEILNNGQSIMEGRYNDISIACSYGKLWILPGRI